ncbi:MAG: hypothetical protein AAF533_04780 [Acidobacteriota bacterium]
MFARRSVAYRKNFRVVLMAACAGLASTASAVLLTVDDDGVECPLADHATIQDAVNAAAGLPGPDDIRICEGTYPENVIIGPSNTLEIFGDGVGDTIVTGVAGSAGPIIDIIDAGTVTLRQLTVDGQSAMTPGTVVYGVRFDGTNGNLRQSEVRNIRDALGTSEGVGVRVQSTGGSPISVTVRNNLLDNVTRVFVSADDPGVNVNVFGNLIAGPVAPTVIVPNGAQVSGGAVGTVARNVFEDLVAPPSATESASAVILFCSEPTVVEGNTIIGADIGIAVTDSQDIDLIDNDIIDSNFDGVSFQFIGESLTGASLCPSGLVVPVSGNTIACGNITGSGESGISLVNFDPDNAGVTDNTLIANHISDNAFAGIAVFEFSGAYPSDNTFDCNDITENGVTDIFEESVGMRTAGTANLYVGNGCDSSQVTGLCSRPPLLSCHEDFEAGAAGAVASNLFQGMTITGTSPVMIFNTDAPSCDDHDLATPWLASSGGTGNLTARDNVLVLDEGGACSPDDNEAGGIITIEFDCPRAVEWVGILDADDPGGEVRAYDRDGNLLANAPIPQLDDGSWQPVMLNTCLVDRLEVQLAGSGALTEISCEDVGGAEARFLSVRENVPALVSVRESAPAPAIESGRDGAVGLVAAGSVRSPEAGVRGSLSPVSTDRRSAPREGQDIRAERMARRSGTPAARRVSPFLAPESPVREAGRRGSDGRR